MPGGKELHEQRELIEMMGDAFNLRRRRGRGPNAFQQQRKEL
jgi:hypothetical protein